MAIKYYEKMPVVPLRGLVVMPYTLLSFDAGRDKSVAAIETAAENDGLVFLTAQKDPKLTDITAKQLYEIYQEELSAELEKEKAVNEAVGATNYLWSPITQLQFDKVIVVNSKIYFSVAYTSTDKANSLLLFEFDPWNETLSYADCIPLNKYIHNLSLIHI